MLIYWTPKEAGHLLRRAGFSAGPDEIAASIALGREETVNRLLSGQPLDGSKSPSQLPSIEQLTADGTSLKADNINDQQLYWLYRMAHTSFPLEEKMTLFWHGHFATSYSKVNDVPLMIRQNQLFRKYALGSFKELVQEVSKDPAMMIWLDIQSNQKGRPNENYARELLELYTIGIGNYTEEDVREGARAFTGWHFDRKAQKVRFDPKKFDDGVKKLLEEEGRFDASGAIDVIFEQEELPVFMARKLLRFFAVDNPSKAWVDRVAADFAAKETVGDVLRSLFLSDEFYDPQVIMSLVRAPAVYVAGIIKMLELPLSRTYVEAMRSMEQNLFFPPDVAGWRGGDRWLGTSALLARCRFAEETAYKTDRNLLVSSRFLPENPDKAESWVRLWAQQTGIGELGPRTLEVLSEYAEECMDGVSPLVATRLRGLLYMLLASPEAQMH
jgi:uncharacterized protein (DUF1800 family)